MTVYILSFYKAFLKLNSSLISMWIIRKKTQLFFSGPESPSPVSTVHAFGFAPTLSALLLRFPATRQSRWRPEGFFILLFHHALYFVKFFLPVFRASILWGRNEIIRPRTGTATPRRNDHTKERKVGRRRGEELKKRDSRHHCKSVWKPVGTQSGDSHSARWPREKKKKARKEIKGKTLCFLVLNY